MCILWSWGHLDVFLFGMWIGLVFMVGKEIESL